jgi:hypothetical protein
LASNTVPPEAVLYQSIVSPANTVAVRGGIIPEAQNDLSPPLTGGRTEGHIQLGAVTCSIFMQPFAAVTVTVIFVPDKTPAIDQTFPLVLVTVPAVLVTMPELTVTAMEYVARLGAQVAGVVVTIEGIAFTTFDILPEVVEQPLALVTITLTAWPFINVLVVKFDEAPFCTLTPATLKL